MEKLELLFSALVVNRHNMCMLHWGTTGRDFDTYHELANEYCEQFAEFTDDVAEIILMTSNTLPTLSKCITNLNDSDGAFVMLGENKQLFTSEDFLNHVTQIFTQLLKLYDDVMEDVPGDIESKLHEHYYWIRKELQYKSKRRK